MFKEPQPGSPAKPIDWHAYLTEKMGEVTGEQIQDFKRKIIPDGQEAFERETNDTKIALTVMGSLTEEELLALKSYKDKALKETNKDLYILGFHSVGSNWLKFMLYTGQGTIGGKKIY